MALISLGRLGLGAGLALVLAAAQCVPPPRGGHGYRVPQGSYLSTCRDVYVGGRGNLRAECRDNSGRWLNASLPLPCYGDIANRNGALVCRDGQPDYAVPDGPYLGQCVNARVNRNNVLVADCQRRRTGQWVTTRLQLPCYGEVVFRRGELRCRYRQ